MKYFIFPLACLVFLCSCEQDDTNATLLQQASINEMIIKSSDRIRIDGLELELQASIWLDFMPGTDAGGQGLISINWLVSVDETEIPAYIVLADQYVIAENDLWHAAYSEEDRESPGHIIERISRDGPLWEPEIFVTIVAEVKSLKDDTSYYVRLDNQKILRTE